MAGPPIETRYVVALPRPSGTRLFCTDSLRDEWQGKLCYAEQFYALHEAEQVAGRHGAKALALRDALMLETAT